MMELSELFKYFHQSNKDYIEAIAARQDLPERARVLMSHILNAQAIWIDRIMEEEKPRFEVWEMHADHLLLAIQNSLIEATSYVMQEFELGQEVTYVNSKGKKFKNSVRDILFHIINHGTHHRAQIAVLFSRSGLKAPVNDYIFRARTEI
ncbi:MAG: damage-inducible protein DinB [Bacteroidia bacterium]|nr:damage-inducible protein DinB [Bacteroidia bacterium]